MLALTPCTKLSVHLVSESYFLKPAGINYCVGERFRQSWLEGGMCTTRPQTGCPWPSAASWDSSVPFPASVLSQVSLLITGGTLAEVKAASDFVSPVPSSFAGCPGSLC